VRLFEAKIHHEAGRYAIVGLVATLVDVMIFNLIITTNNIWNSTNISFIAKTVSSVIAIFVAYLGHKKWTFKHRTGNDSIPNQVGLFMVVNVIGLGIALGCLWVSRYVLGFSSQLSDNVSANLVGLVLATAFRFLASRQFVFTK
jgi:putative flippase GtrA